MPWVKLDDLFSDHPKVMEAGPLAAWLHVCAMCYCGRYLTDGFIPTGQVRKLADVDNAQELASKLVDVGLWENAEGGYQIHDWLEYNPSREQVLREREAAKERMSKLRSGEVRPNNQRSSSSPSPSPSPSPKPETHTRPNSQEETSSPKAPMTPKEKPRPRFPDDSEPAKLVTTLRGLIIGNNPTARAAKMTVRECDNWAEDFERLIRLDGRDPPTIERVMRWAQSDQFWRANILSPKKLREKWDTLWLQMQRPEKQGGNNGKARGSPGEGDADSSLDRFKRFD